jgi:hypothetical protein
MIGEENLLNKNVRHKQWGRGVVESVNERYITVRFCDINKGEKTASFKFPDAFDKGYLAFEK